VESGDTVFGDAGWREVANQPTPRKKGFLVDRYLQVLRDAGFPYTLTVEMVDETSHELLLVFGTTNQLGVEKMNAFAIHGTARPPCRSPKRRCSGVGGWTLNKLELLALYFKVYRRVAGNSTYIDAFAGDGEVRIQDELRPGSATLAARAGAFKQLLLYERPRVAARLAAYLEDNLTAKQFHRCTIRPGNCNPQLIQDLDNGVFARDRPVFAFLDPDSTQLDWNTVEALGAYKRDEEYKIELWILFNTHQALMRLLPKQARPGYETSGSATTLDRVMGDRAAWWDVYEQARTPGRLVSRYAERLENVLGYGAARVQRILDPESGRPQYYMVHASDHPAAHEFMRWAQVQTAGDRSDDVPFPGMP
jgi:three-Cys-motif partner protein